LDTRDPKVPLIMPTTALSSALKAKKKAEKLSITAMSKAIGVNVQSVTSALKGKSIPNASTAPRYAKYLGISLEAFQKMTAVKPVVAAAVKLTGRKSGKRSKSQKGAQSSAPITAAASVRPARAPRPISLADAVALAADPLAVAVYKATAAQRKIIGAVLEA
jgi:transcriptional regulator with XRE-family HTH domain